MGIEAGHVDEGVQRMLSSPKAGREIEALSDMTRSLTLTSLLDFVPPDQFFPSLWTVGKVLIRSLALAAHFGIKGSLMMG